jgi:hypothetical protein
VELVAALLGAVVGGIMALAGLTLEHRRQYKREFSLLLYREATEIANLLRLARHAALKARRESRPELSADELQEYWLRDLGIFLLPEAKRVEPALLEAIRSTRALLKAVGLPEDAWREADNRQHAAHRAFETSVREALGDKHPDL